MPATTYSPTHFRVQYNRPSGALLEALRRRERAPFAREPSAEILSVLCEGSPAERNIPTNTLNVETFAAREDLHQPARLFLAEEQSTALLCQLTQQKIFKVSS
jgi:hypothetical protein